MLPAVATYTNNTFRLVWRGSLAHASTSCSKVLTKPFLPWQRQQQQRSQALMMNYNRLQVLYPFCPFHVHPRPYDYPTKGGPGSRHLQFWLTSGKCLVETRFTNEATYYHILMYHERVSCDSGSDRRSLSFCLPKDSSQHPTCASDKCRSHAGLGSRFLLSSLPKQTKHGCQITIQSFP